MSQHRIKRSPKDQMLELPETSVPTNKASNVAVISDGRLNGCDNDAFSEKHWNFVFVLCVVYVLRFLFLWICNINVLFVPIFDSLHKVCFFCVHEYQSHSNERRWDSMADTLHEPQTCPAARPIRTSHLSPSIHTLKPCMQSPHSFNYTSLDWDRMQFARSVRIGRCKRKHYNFYFGAWKRGEQGCKVKLCDNLTSE